jgi:hypothetical protein
MVEAVSHEQETRHMKKKAEPKGNSSLPDWRGSRGKVPIMNGSFVVVRQGKHQPYTLKLR